MSDLTPSTPEHASEEPLLDTLLREAVPEIKLALGDLIDRDNQRAIPDRYARMLPQTVLMVTLRPDAAGAVHPIAAELERELTDSCLRHGSLYDREYRVKLREAASPGAPLFRVSQARGEEAAGPSVADRRPEPAPPPPSTASSASTATVMAPPPVDAGSETVHAPPPRSPEIRVERGPAPAPSPEPAVDPDATRLEGVMPAPPTPAAAPPPGPRWEADRWELVIEDEEGNERERFPIPGPMATVGRQTENPDLRSDIAITDAPHVSRRQLALVWAPRGETGGFTVYNLGLNPLHVGEKEVAGANRGKGALELDELMLGHTDWVPPGTAMKIGEHGPVLRIAEIGASEDDGAEEDEVPVDPDATRFG